MLVHSHLMLSVLFNKGKTMFFIKDRLKTQTEIYKDTQRKGTQSEVSFQAHIDPNPCNRQRIEGIGK